MKNFNWLLVGGIIGGGLFWIAVCFGINRLIAHLIGG
jgi:hypothetical protein